MKSYLDLVRISARVRRRQSRMTRLCIALAVFLVTAIFGMADMELASQRVQAIQQYGSWIAAVKGGITEEESALIAARPDVTRAAWYGAINTRLGSDFSIDGKRVAVCGFDESWHDMFPGASYLEGGYPSESGTISMTSLSKQLFGIQTGDTVTLTFPEGDSVDFRVAGFFSDTSMMNEQDSAGLILNRADYLRYFSAYESAEMWFYLELSPFCSVQRSLSEIQTQFGLTEDQIGKNPKLLGLRFQSDDPFMRMLYSAAGILTLLVAVSSILMMAGSLNSSVAQRTEFFGLLRCLGATPKQIRVFVRREALGWCALSIPAGLLGGTAICWVLCEILRFLTPSYFETLPRFGLSAAALASGTILGFVTVLLATRSPAKRASQVAPLTAAAGNAGTVYAAKKAADTRFFRVETALGIHHAIGSKRNFALMAGSFAFSIILFLSFSAAVDFMHHAINPLRPSAADVSIYTGDSSCTIPASLAGQIAAHPAVKNVFGRSFAYGLEGECGGRPVKLDLVSYETLQFGWARQSLLDGDLSAAENGAAVLSAFDSGSGLQTGDFLTINGFALPVSGRLAKSPFDREPGTEMVFCSEALFHQLAGDCGYSILDVQFHRGVTDADVAEIRSLAGEGLRFSDRLLSNREARGAYFSFALFLYGFLAVIALIAVFHIINSVSMSVSARMRQYGAMRAIGMSVRQLIRMVAAEAFTCVSGGFVLGTLAGLPLHKLLFSRIVTFQWGDPWTVPWKPLLAIVLVMLASAVLAVAAPAKRLRNLSVTDTLSAE